jgi:hypothetical protein
MAHSSLVITTKLLIVLDDQLLSTKKEKKMALPFVDRDKIKSITKIDKNESIRRYGKKGKYGALIILSNKIHL